MHPISKLKLTGEFAAEEEPAVAVDVLQREDASGVSCGSCNARAAVVARPDRVAQEGLTKSDGGVIKSSREVASEDPGDRDGVSGPAAGPLRTGVSDMGPCNLRLMMSNLYQHSTPNDE